MKHLSRFLVVSAALAVAASSQAFLIAGNATGYFTNSTGTANLGATNQGLTYTGASFSSATEFANGGFYAVGGTSFLDSFGQFALTTLPATYTGGFFLLTLTFTSPSTTTPNPASMVTTLLGSVSRTGTGGASITFGNTANFEFDGGTFDLTVNRVSITPGNNVFVTGDGVGSAVPGPAALASFGMGALGMIRRRRKAAK